MPSVRVDGPYDSSVCKLLRSPHTFFPTMAVITYVFFKSICLPLFYMFTSTAPRDIVAAHVCVHVPTHNTMDNSDLHFPLWWMTMGLSHTPVVQMVVSFWAVLIPYVRPILKSDYLWVLLLFEFLVYFACSNLARNIPWKCFSPIIFSLHSVDYFLCVHGCVCVA